MPRTAPNAKPVNACATGSSGIFRFDGSLTGDQRSRLLEIADKYPLHRTLVSEINTKTRVFDKRLASCLLDPAVQVGPEVPPDPVVQFVRLALVGRLVPLDQRRRASRRKSRLDHYCSG